MQLNEMLKCSRGEADRQTGGSNRQAGYAKINNNNNNQKAKSKTHNKLSDQRCRVAHVAQVDNYKHTHTHKHTERERERVEFLSVATKDLGNEL